VHAVADGEVTAVIDEYPDNLPDHPLQPVTIDNIAGNHVIIRIGRNEYALFAHLKQHSIRVQLHQKVKKGDLIADVGNSGNTTGAHLHFQLMNGNSAIAAEGIPFVFDRFTFLGYGKDFEEDHHPVEPRRNEMPVDDEVIRIP
jgi:murein DD-endopeptidase MepM/ murein hydrolase activator NlpD